MQAREECSFLPGLIIAGTNKAGTSSLWSYLASHPQVAASAVKETCYWLPLRYGSSNLAPIEEYQRQWSGSDPTHLRMEATPGYFLGGRTVAEAIDAACPDVKIVIMLREPAARALSFMRYRQSMVALPSALTFREYVSACSALTPQQARDREFHAYSGVENGLYSKHMQAWIDVFGARLVVAFFDDLQSDPRGLLLALSAWLGLDTTAAKDITLGARNVTVAYRHAGLQRWALRANQAANVFLLRHPSLKRRLLTAYRTVNSQAAIPVVSEDEQVVLRELSAWYAEQNAGLRSMVAANVITPLPDWLT